MYFIVHGARGGGAQGHFHRKSCVYDRTERVYLLQCTENWSTKDFFFWGGGDMFLSKIVSERNSFDQNGHRPIYNVV